MANFFDKLSLTGKLAAALAAVAGAAAAFIGAVLLWTADPPAAWFLALVGVGGAAVGLGYFNLVTARLAAHIHAIEDRLIALSHGASDLSIRLPVEGDAEVGAAAAEFNRFLEGLDGVVAQIRSSSDEIGGSSKSLTEITRQFTSNISESAQVMSQISQNTSHVAQNTQAAAAATHQAGDIAQQGGRLAVLVVDKMKAAQAAVFSTTASIHELGQRSEQIGEIVDVITKIADQTNLLSLNAAIEAARAGETGRGFGVVADEIRKLAESSASSAQQIAVLIQEVLTETGRAVEAAERGNRAVAEGYESTLEAEKLFSAIASEVAQVTQQVSQVSANFEQVAASTEEATASSEELTATMHEVSRKIQEMSAIVERLTAAVAQFKTTGAA